MNYLTAHGNVSSNNTIKSYLYLDQNYSVNSSVKKHIGCLVFTFTNAYVYTQVCLMTKIQPAKMT